jgi:glycosyltransferase involved in cell wall biosynthesis
LIIGIILRILGKKVIFDSHENYYEDMKSKSLPKVVKSTIGFAWWLFEYVIGRMLSHIIVANSYTLQRYPARKATVIANYAPLRIIDGVVEGREIIGSKFCVVYVGGISSRRGIEKLNESLMLLNDNRIELHLAGPIRNANLKKKIKNYTCTVHHGILPWEEVTALIRGCDLGTALFQPIPTFLLYTHENVIKIFEYMALGLPVLISDFPKLKEFVESNDCGIAVDPTSPKAIAEAIKYLYENPDIRKRMGENGKRAFLERYNWEIEEKKLLNVYMTVLKSDRKQRRSSNSSQE